VKILVQRVSRAEVSVGGEVVGKVGTGLLVFLGLEKGDDASRAEEGARKVAALRIFPDEAGRMNRAVAEAGGGVLVVSQFTLAADLSRGRRPGFERALPPAEAEPLYEHFAAALELSGLPVARGVFGAMMDVALVNAGPATFWIEIPERGVRGTETGPA
jgi:D-tyrosyl-tRNA(Tyr) deacylase